RYGGILADIGAHQVEQFLFFTDSSEAEVVHSQVGNFANPKTPELEDFGDMVLRSPDATGYVRLDWFTPDGLGVWGDGRHTILGTEGYIELRKYIDIGGRPGANHLFLVDKEGARYIDCSSTTLPYGPALRDDVLNRTETAMGQQHCFLATELALTAEANATWIAGERPEVRE
ncbi:MAG: gfo/Idh/MocA family oxidoreductase, partial [Pseudomonadota bacterium]